MFSILRRRNPHTLEPLRAAHAADCARLHALYFSHPWSVSEFESLIASTNVHGAAAVDGQEKVLGFILIRCAADEAEILTIAVDKSSRKQGIGRELLTEQAERLRRIRVRKLFLEVDEDNAAARKLYSNFGFAQVGTRQGYYRTSGGKPANALILSCELG